MKFIPESKLKGLLSDKLDPLFILNMDGNIIETNLAVNSILGYSSEDLYNKNLLAVYSSRYREKISTIVQLVIKGDVFSCPYPFITKNGEVVPVNTKFYIGWWKEKNVIVAVSTNLSAKYFSREIFFKIGANYYFSTPNHYFSLVFYPDEVTAGATTMDVYLSHHTSDKNATYTSAYYVGSYPSLYYHSFNILDMVYRFTGKAGNAPTKIALHTNINETSTTLPSTGTTYTINYTKTTN